jgi:RimJ/RimL family protein N-acetyltransferase
MLPTFHTERLIVRPRGLGDLDACLAMDSDPEVVRYVAGPWDDAAAHLKFLIHRMTTAYPPGLGYWSVVPRDDPDRFLGWVLLIPSDAVGPEIEVGWRLNRASWGHGYATEATRAVLRHGFTGAGVDRVVATVHADNARSQRVAEKIGLRLIGARTWQGLPAKDYALTRAEAGFAEPDASSMLERWPRPSTSSG